MKKSELIQLIENKVRKALLKEENTNEGYTIYCIGFDHLDKILIEPIELDTEGMEEEGFDTMDEYRQYREEDVIGNFNQHGSRAICFTGDEIEQIYTKYKNVKK